MRKLLIILLLVPVIMNCGGKNIKIADTPVIVKKVRNISELFTMSYYDECVVEHTIKRKLLPDKRLVLIARGNIIAGFNLKNIKKENMIINEKKVTINLQPATILAVITNPSDYETFIDKGKMKFSERKKAQEKARKILKENALKKGIIKKSEESGKKILVSFFKSIGFKNVEINIMN